MRKRKLYKYNAVLVCNIQKSHIDKVKCIIVQNTPPPKKKKLTTTVFLIQKEFSCGRQISKTCAPFYVQGENVGRVGFQIACIHDSV